MMAGAVKRIDVLVSYNTNQFKYSQRLIDVVKFLRNNLNGFNIWLDIHDTDVEIDKNEVANKKAENERYQRIDECTIFMCCITDDYSKSDAVYELSYAKQNKKSILFVVLEDLETHVSLDKLRARFGYAGSLISTYFRYTESEKLLNTIENVLKVPPRKSAKLTIDKQMKRVCTIDNGCQSPMLLIHNNIQGCVKNLKQLLLEKSEHESELIKENKNLKIELKMHEHKEFLYQNQLTETLSKYRKVDEEYSNLKKTYLGKLSEMQTENTRLRSNIAAYNTSLNNEEYAALRNKIRWEKENIRLQKSFNSVCEQNKRLLGQVNELENKRVHLEHMIRQLKEKYRCVDAGNDPHENVIRPAAYLLYCHDDHENDDILRLKRILSQRFNRVRDHTAIPFGPSQQENTQKLIEKCRTVIVVVTKHLLNDEFAMAQLKLAKETYKKPIFPIFLENIKIDETSKLFHLLGSHEFKSYKAYLKRQFDAGTNLWKGIDFEQLLYNISGKV